MKMIFRPAVLALAVAAVALSLVGCQGTTGNAALELIGIAVTTPPTKTVYEIGEAFDPAGMVVTATYDDGSTAVVPHADLEIGALDSASAGQRTVTVTYRGKTADVIVTVIALEPPPAPESVTLTPAAVDVGEDQTHQFTSSVLPPEAPQAVAWTVEPATAGTITPAGFLTLTGATAGDTVTIRATASGTDVSGTATVTVTAPVHPRAMVSAGSSHTMAIREDGTLWAWGFNGQGRLGNGTTVGSNAPIRIGNHSDWVWVSAGEAHTSAIRADGSLWAWGDNSHGRLGDGTTENRLVPTRIGTDYDWVTVAAGGSVISGGTSGHTLAIKTDGTLWAWGFNGFGQLGIGVGGGDHFSPVMVGSASNWASVSAGGNHSAALRADGSLWTWGWNNFGAIGIGNTGQVPAVSPVNIQSGMTWVSVSAGMDHTAGIRTDGTLWAWGHNYQGRIGDGSRVVSRGMPVQIGDAEDWKAVSAGQTHTMAVRTDGSMWAWGSNWSGQHGDGTGTERNIPTQIDTWIEWETVSAGGGFTMAVAQGGTIWGWGIASGGQLGNGYTSSGIVTPVEPGTEWVYAAAALNFTVAIRDDGGGTRTMWTWGNNLHGQLGDASGVSNRNFPSRVGDYTDWVSVRAVGQQALAMRADRSLWAWGDNGNGRLGDGTTESRSTPVRIGGDAEWKYFSMGGAHGMAIREDGSLWGWGFNNSGRVGDNSTTNRHSPVRIGQDYDWQSVSTGNHTMAIKTDGSLWAWGLNAHAQLGLGVTGGNHFVPTRVGTDNDWASVSAGTQHTVAIRTDGSLWAWGNGEHGRLGDGSTQPRNSPVRVGADNDWASVCAGHWHTMAIRTDGTLWAWGNNGFGALGDGTSAHRSSPVQVGTGIHWSFVSAGGNSVPGGGGHTAAIGDDDGGNRSLWTWGNNAFGQLGNWRSGISPVPVQPAWP